MDAVALASVVSSGAVGVATVTASFFNARAERKTRGDEGQASRRHERETAHRARLFERQAQTYVDLMTYLGRVLERIEETHPLITYGPVDQRQRQEEEPEDRGVLTTEQQEEAAQLLRDLEARISAYGSREVAEQVEAFIRQMRIFYLDAGTWYIMNQQASGQHLTDARLRMDASRQQTRDTYAAIRELVRTELAAP
jgi:hypothetical protein